MPAFFDTNVLVYCYDRFEARKQELAKQLLVDHLRGRSLVVSTQVMQEFYSAAVVKRRLLTPDDALAVVKGLRQATIVPSSADLVIDALTLCQRHQLSVWDALIVQAALQAGCEVLYSEDVQTGRRFGDLQVVNPFDGSVQEPAKAYRVKAKATKVRAAAQTKTRATARR